MNLESQNTLPSHDQKSFPDFMIIGAQKAGTTALYEYLSKHVAIIATEVKELHYFSCDARYREGIEYYKSLFRFGVASQLTFDASPSYLHNMNAPKRIHAHYPNTKFVILLRDPVERAYSAWNMYRKRFMANRNWYFDEWVRFCGPSWMDELRRRDDRILNFRDYVIDEINLGESNRNAFLEAPILSHGHYCLQIQRYLSLFPENQMLVIESSDFRNQTAKCLERIETFLAIPHIDWGAVDLAPVFEGDYLGVIDPEIAYLLSNYYAASNESLYQILGQRFPWGAK